MAIKGLSELLKKHKETEMTEEQFESELNKLLPETWKPAGVYNELNDKYKLLESQKAETEKLLKEANDAKTASDEFKTKYDDLLKTQKAEKEKYEADLNLARKNSGIDLALVKAGARSSKAVKALLDMEKITLSDKGEVIGVDEQLKTIKAENDYLFAVSENPNPVKPTFGNGGSPAPSGNGIEAMINAGMGVKN